MRSTLRPILLALATLGVSAATVLAQPTASRPAPPPTRPSQATAVDTTGWTLLGQQPVGGRKDRDRIDVPAYTGRFDELMVVVRDSDVVIEDLVITFANGEPFKPVLKHTFKEGARSRAIDLPGDNRRIVSIDVMSRNLPGGGRATVALYARDRKATRPAPPMPAPVAFDATGWTPLGAQTVDGRRDRDTIRVPKWMPFDQLVLVVKDSDLELKDLTVEFVGGGTWSPRLAHTFKEGARSRVIDLPGKDRKIKTIKLAYANIAGGGRASVEVYGRDTGRPAPAPVAPPTWENRGWAKLGARTVDGWRDRDRLVVASPKAFSELTFAVSGSDVAVTQIVVTFGNGQKLTLDDRIVFAEGTRTRPIDLPGKLRKIRSIEFAYANLPGGGRATVEVWGRSKR